MKKISVIYYTETGNAEAMAEAISEGAKEAGAEVKYIQFSDATLEDFTSADAVALGCSAKGEEELEEDVVQPFIDSLEDVAKDKKVLLFGSYGWGEGDWMETWVETMKGYGADVVGEGIIVNEEPEDEHLAECKEAGKNLV